MTEPDSVLNLFDAVHAAVQKIGVDATIRAVERLSTQDEDYFNPEFQIVMKAVCDVYEVDLNELVYGKSKKEGRRISALECSAYIVCDIMQIDRKMACKFLNKHFTIVSRYITAARFYDANHPQEKHKVNKLKQVQEIVFSHPYIIEKYPNIEITPYGKETHNT